MYNNTDSSTQLNMKALFTVVGVRLVAVLLVALLIFMIGCDSAIGVIEVYLISGFIGFCLYARPSFNNKWSLAHSGTAAVFLVFGIFSLMFVVSFTDGRLPLRRDMVGK